LVEEILERTLAYYETYLWENAGQVRSRLARDGITEAGLRAFGVGYASERGPDLLEHLVRWRYGADDLVAAGVARTSDRGNLHAYFRSRVMFPMRDAGGRNRPPPASSRTRSGR
jgi:DNA primase